MLLTVKLFCQSNRLALLLFVFVTFLTAYFSASINKTWLEQRYSYETFQDDNGAMFYKHKQEDVAIANVIPYENSPLSQANLNQLTLQPSVNEAITRNSEQWVKQAQQVFLLKAVSHYGLWSLLPAIFTIILCLITRKPALSLLGGIVIGTILLGGVFSVGEQVKSSIEEQGGINLLIIYVLLLGALLGVWAKTGAGEAFSKVIIKKFVKGPRSAKVATWLMGVSFFQGGTLSTVMVGSTMRPVADKAKVSHEEMSYIVDSTASPIAALIALNAWPAYVQALIFVPGVSFLATEADRISFFFSSIPFSFYAIFAVLGTLLLSMNITTFSGKAIKEARQRVLNNGQLDADNAQPLNTSFLDDNQVDKNYLASSFEFIIPVVLIILIALVTYIASGTPKVEWAFGGALLCACSFAVIKGMKLSTLFIAILRGLKGVLLVIAILMFAIILGVITQALGGGLYLVSLLGESIPYLLLPVILQIITMIIAFSTGSSWGTYAIAFPLAMPLAWFIVGNQAIASPELFMMICFAAVLNGSLYGDQCSPISDTTIMSAMSTGCDLIDHVKSQIVPASFAAILAGFSWTLFVYIFI